MISLPARVRPAPSVALPITVAVAVTAGTWIALVRLGTWLGFGPHYPLSSLIGAGMAGYGTWWWASVAVDVARGLRAWQSRRAAR